MARRINLILCKTVLLAGMAHAQSLNEPLPGGGNYTALEWIPADLRASHVLSQDGDLKSDGEMEISITPKAGGAVYTMRFFSGPAAQAASEMIEYTQAAAREMGDAAAAQAFDLTFPEGVSCFGSREDIVIICSFKDLALQFGGEDVDYDTLRHAADQIEPLRSLADKS